MDRDLSDVWREVREIKSELRRNRTPIQLEDSSLTEGRFRVGNGEFRVDGDGVFTLIGVFNQQGVYNVLNGGDVVVAPGGRVTVQGPVPIHLEQANIGGVEQAMIRFGDGEDFISVTDAGGKPNVVFKVGSKRIQLNDAEITMSGLGSLPQATEASYVVATPGGVLYTSAGTGGGGGIPEPGTDLGRFQWPFALSTVTSEYGPRWGRIHEGIDFGLAPALAGAPIIAAGDGVVAVNTFSSGWGNYVRLTHDLGGGTVVSTLYAHMDPASNRAVGSSVSKGDVIGYVGNTGNSFGAHLHFETWTTTSYGSHINPRSFMAAYGPE